MAHLAFRAIARRWWQRRTRRIIHQTGTRRFCKDSQHEVCTKVTMWLLCRPKAWVRFTCLCPCHYDTAPITSLAAGVAAIMVRADV